MHRRFQGRLIVTVVGVLAGCGGSSDGLKREPVSGRVTLDGQVVGKGEITFAPTGGGAPIAAALIENGSYTVERAHGPTLGPQLVRVWSKQPTGKKLPSDVDPGTFFEVTREVIPDRYNIKSELQAEVKEGGENLFDFALKSDSPSTKSARP